MQFETWTPGFIPELVKTGQILLGLVVGLIMGHVERTNATNNSVNKLVLSTQSICVTAMLIGLTFGLLLPETISSSHLSSSILFFTLLLGAAVAANIKNKAVVLGLSWLALIVLAVSAVPSQGVYPDKLIIVIVNVFGLMLLIGGAASISYWAVFKQRRLWPKIGARMVGAWLVAISLMMLAFQQSNVML